MKTLTLLLLLFSVALADAPDESITSYPGGLWCTFHDEKHEVIASVVLLWSQLTDIDHDRDALIFTTKDGIVTLSHLSHTTWMCTSFGSDTRSAKDIE